MNSHKKESLLLTIIFAVIGISGIILYFYLKSKNIDIDEFFLTMINILSIVFFSVSVTIFLELIIKKDNDELIQQIENKINEIKKNDIILGDRSNEIDIVKIEDDFKNINFSMIQNDNCLNEINLLFINLRDEKISNSLKMQ
ncbi:MAG: hypothetical protein PQJ46_16405 [Spirochaetales bacterium]|nr:hypothetical protein [Spirochaetales bacterium]